MTAYERTASAAALAACPLRSEAQAAEHILPEVKVQPPRLPASPYAPDESYRAGRSTTATKTDTPLL